MLIIPNLKSDEVSIEGFHRDASPVYRDNNNAPYFDLLSFELTSFPSEKWMEEFRNCAADFIHEDIRDTCHFEGATLTLCTTKMYARSLQEFINSLKKAFDSVNTSLKEVRDREAEQEKELNDILDNLKF